MEEDFVKVEQKSGSGSGAKGGSGTGNKSKKSSGKKAKSAVVG